MFSLFRQLSPTPKTEKKPLTEEEAEKLTTMVAEILSRDDVRPSMMEIILHLPVIHLFLLLSL